MDARVNRIQVIYINQSRAYVFVFSSTEEANN